MKPIDIALVGIALAMNAAHGQQPTPSWASIIEQHETGAPAPSVRTERWLAQQELLAIALSPDGRHVAYLALEGQLTGLWMIDVDTLRRERILQTRYPITHEEPLHWARDGQGVYLATGRSVDFVPLTTGRPLKLANVASDSDSIVAYAPNAEAVYISTLAPGGSFEVVRFDGSESGDVVYRGPIRVRSLLFDTKGNVQFVYGAQTSRHVIAARYEDSEFRIIYECRAVDECWPLYYSPETNSLLLQSNVDNDLTSISRLSLDDGKLAMVHQDPLGESDVYDVQIDPDDGALSLVAYYGDSLINYSLREDWQSHLKYLTLRLSPNDLTIETSEGPWLIVERGARLQVPNVYVYDPLNRQIAALAVGTSADRISPELLSDTFPVRYQASDELELHGFVTMPKGVPLDETPLVTIVHGGPWTREYRRFDTGVQFFVNRGYIVFVPNIRGSAGYGKRYLLSAKGEFGRGRALQDVVEGVDYLIGNGIGNRERLGIMGHSYGGFVTLSALAFEPLFFQAGIASAPPVDFVDTMMFASRRTLHWAGLPIENVLADLAFDPDSVDEINALRERAPQRRINKIVQPLFVAAAANDDRVNVVDVRNFVTEMESAEKPVTYLEDPATGHNFEDRAIRKALLHLEATFWAQYLGGRQEAEALGEDVTRYLHRSLRLGTDEPWIHGLLPE